MPEGSDFLGGGGIVYSGGVLVFNAHVGVCLCVSVCETERERQRQSSLFRGGTVEFYTT